MYERLFFGGFSPCLLIVCAACDGSGEYPADSVAVFESVSMLTDSNALNPNARNPNALNPNPLSPKTLASKVLNEVALESTALTAIRDPGDAGALSRQLLRYIVGCALDTTQSFSFSWTDDQLVVHAETYWGLLGLATNWRTEALSTVDEQWVSACVASRVNWYGATVIISSRASHAMLNSTGTAERSEYPMEEGAFWGNLFTDPPHLYACHHGPNEAHSRTYLRDCATGHIGAPSGPPECGIVNIVGTCDTKCAPLDPAGSYHPSCTDDTGASWSRPITTFLP
jgi:hypothetical protein